MADYDDFDTDSGYDDAGIFDPYRFSGFEDTEDGVKHSAEHDHYETDFDGCGEDDEQAY